VELRETFVDLGLAPLANALIRHEQQHAKETFYPLHAFVCDRCFLVQVEEFAPPEAIFRDYPYFSSFSDAWLEHCARYARDIVPRLGLGHRARVVEIASNDGALLGLLQRQGLTVLGIEPARHVARAAIERGIPTETDFFGRETAARVRREFAADLIVANNVLAHVPDLNDFVGGLKLLLASGGTITIEFPHLLRLIEERQFDTIYHEHFSYFSLMAAETALARHGLMLFDVEPVATHGGSLRLYVCHADDGRSIGSGVAATRAAERAAGLDRIETYRDFAAAVVALKCDVLEFFINARRAGKRVVGYAAAAKASTLLNYCGVGREFIDYVVDRSPHKQGLLMPGTRLAIHPPARVFETKPDYLFILAWNWREEILESMAGVRTWGGHFVVPIPKIEVI
jgi:SAM-dependent methyltransferase